MQADLTCELDTDVIAPTENNAHTEIMKRADGLMMHPSVETAGGSDRIIMGLQSTRKLGRMLEGDLFEAPAILHIWPRD